MQQEISTHSSTPYHATRPTVDRTILLYDDQGQPFLVDADLDIYFLESHYKKTVYNRDGERWVDDYGVHSTLSCYQKQPKKLERWVWEVWHAQPLPRGYTVRLDMLVPDKPVSYCLSNILLEKKVRSA